MLTSQVLDLSPRILLNGFPKSGLHLATSMARAIALPTGDRVQWFGNVDGNAWTTRTIKAAHVVAPEVFRTFTVPIQHYWPEEMNGPKGLYLKAHISWAPDLERLLFGYGIVTVFIYRDFRDVVVSQARHVLDDRPAWRENEGDQLKHSGKAEYRAIQDREGFGGVLIACIEGLGEYAGLFERWEMYAPWLDLDWVLPMTFEEMRLKPYNAAARFLRYLEEWEAKLHGLSGWALSDAQFAETQAVMVRQMADPRGSPTFRKGRVGSWRDHFTKRVKECFKAHDREGWLVRLGYAEDDGW